MNLLKKTFIISSIFFLFITFHSAFGYICVNTTSNYKMFGSVLKANVLKNPFRMAFQDEHFKDYKIFYADSDKDLIEQVDEMIQKDCSVILGLFTSHDCLVSGQILKQNKVVSLSSSCSDDKISKFFPYIYTASPKLSDYSKTVANHINNSSILHIVAFYQPSDVYSNSGFKAFKKYVKKDVVDVQVNSGGAFDVQKITELLQDSSASIVFFTYPLPSVQILASLDTAHLITDNVSIIGSSSWIFDVSVFRPVKSILFKAKKVLTPSLVSKKENNSSLFTKEFFKLYSREPDIVEILTYDITRMAARCYTNILLHSKYNNDAFLSCINDNYMGVSGYFRFRKNSPFSIRKIYLVNFLEKI